MSNPSNYFKQSPNRSNYTKTSPSASGYGQVNIETGSLLLETGDYLLLETGDKLLLEKSHIQPSNYVAENTP